MLGLKDVFCDGIFCFNFEMMVEDDEEILEVEEEYELIFKWVKKIIKGESDDKLKLVGSLFFFFLVFW